MKIVSLIWLSQFVAKLQYKHHVEVAEVEQVFFDRPVYRLMERGHVSGENVYRVLGQTDSGRYLVAFFVYKQDRNALIISARDMNGRERKHYETQQ